MFIEQLTPDLLYSTGVGANIINGTGPPPPPPLPTLKCPKGQKVDTVADAGDNGSCGCEDFCASDWTGAIKAARPHWKGATSAFPGAKTKCVCVQATHWCPHNKGVGCGASCSTIGKPTPKVIIICFRIPAGEFSDVP